VFDWVREANRGDAATVGNADLREMLDVFGLANLLEPEAEAPPEEIVELAQERETARVGREFARADALRDEIAARGWQVRDGPDGPELFPLR
jgi:cysteinyl-tRNA synthetase